MKPSIGRRRARATALVLVGWLAVGSSPAAQGENGDTAPTRAERIEALEEAIAEQREALEEVRGKRGDAVDELETLRDRLDALRSEIEALERELEKTSETSNNGE